MAYRKRVFLNPISISAPSFIQAVADSSDEGTYLLGNQAATEASYFALIRPRYEGAGALPGKAEAQLIEKNYGRKEGS